MADNKKPIRPSSQARQSNRVSQDAAEARSQRYLAMIKAANPDLVVEHKVSPPSRPVLPNGNRQSLATPSPRPAPSKQSSTGRSPTSTSSTPARSSLPSPSQDDSSGFSCEGALTKSGLLYEGSLEDWTSRMNALLELRGYRDFFTARDATESQSNTLNPLVGSIIRNQISPNLLNRIPPRLYHHPQALVKYLAKLCKPFPLLDLNIETRTEIYNIVFAQHDDDQASSQRLSGCNVPAITMASSQLRSEAWPLRLQWTILRHDIPNNLLVDRDTVHYALTSWVSDLPRQILKHCRRIVVTFEGPFPESSASQNGVVFSLPEKEEDHGLNIFLANSSPDFDTKEATNALQRHAMDHEDLRKTFGWGGEAIFVALTSKPELWQLDSVVHVRSEPSASARGSSPEL